MLNYLRKKISYDNPLRMLWHKAKGVLAALIHGFPARKMVVIGVTGTNGKTTTTHMIAHTLRAAGRTVGMISTVSMRMNDDEWPNETKKTTLSPFLTQRFLKRCAKKGIQYMVIECSSHALHQSRLWGIPFAIAVMTNITHEHLDYHGTMAKYAEAKRILFETVEKCCHLKPRKEIRNIPHQHTFVLNCVDRFYQDFMALSYPVKISYGIEQGDLKAKDASYSKEGSKFTIVYKGEGIDVALKMPGSFNVENALAATGACLGCKLAFPEIKKGLETFKGVPGRIERIMSPKGFEAIVDFALTPDALDRLYQTIRETAQGRVIGIIGSCGDRDREKRPGMGRIVAEHTDITIVTDEEPYSENPKTIMEAVLSGAKQAPEKKMDRDLFLIEDRYKAIEFAVEKAKEGDTIVITGMGAFTTRTMNHGPIPWDERKIVREIIRKYS